MKKSTQSFRVGIVTGALRSTPIKGLPFWELRYTDPVTRLEVRRRVRDDLKEARAIAKHLNVQAHQGRGHLATEVHAPGIEDALLDAIKLANTRPLTARQRTAWAKRFLLWLAREHPRVSTWNQLAPSTLQAYANELEQSGKAHDTVRLAVAPVKLAWRMVHGDHPELVRPLPRIRITAPPPRRIECLAPAELAVLLDWLRANAPDVWPMACLQALGGLRMLEAAALRVQDVDLAGRTVTVTDTGHHKPKTGSSWRTIPVCDELLEVLKLAIAGQKIKPATGERKGELFVNDRGALWTHDALTKRWRRLLRHISSVPEVIERQGTGRKLTLRPYGLGLVRLGEVPARKLRAAFATMAGRLGVPDRLLKAYIGHSPSDVLGSHYRLIETDELRSVSNALNDWRKLIKTADARIDSGNNLPAASSSA